jgi:hypothetical protein
MLTIEIMITLLAYSLACFGAGIVALTLLFRGVALHRLVSPGTVVATAFILGQGILASLWVLLALGGWFSRLTVFAVVLICVLGGLLQGWSLLKSFGHQVVSIWRELREDTWGWQLVAALSMLLCLLWVTSLGRSLSGDGPAYYLALGKLIAASRHLIPMPGYEFFMNVGLQGEMHFAALMAMYSPDAARLFSWPTISMTGILLTALGRVCGMGRRGQWLTLASLFSSSAVVWLSGDGKVDLFAAALGVAAFYWAVQSRFVHLTGTLFLLGLLSGFSIVAKLSYAPVMVPTMSFLVLWGYMPEFQDRTRWRFAMKSFLRGCIVIVAGLIIAFVPHMIKNALLYGNPLSPLGSEDAVWVHQTWYGADVTRRILFTYPLALTYGSYWAQYGNLSPLLLAFLPLVFYLPRPRPFFSSPLVIVSLTGLIGILAWSIYSPSVFSPRYILGALLLLILLPARAAEYVSLTDSRPRLLAAGVLGLTVISLVAFMLFCLNLIFFPNATIQYLTGTLDQCDRDGVYCTAMELLNQDAKPGSRIYLATYLHYWLRGDLLQCVSNANDQDLPARASGQKAWLKMYKDGFNYLLIDKSSHTFVLDRLNIAQPPEWVDLIPLYSSEALDVYKLRFKNPPSTSKPAVCQRLPSSRIWEVVSP